MSLVWFQQIRFDWQPCRSRRNIWSHWSNSEANPPVNFYPGTSAPLGHAAAAADIRRERQNIEQKAPDSLWIEIMVEMVFGKEVQIWLAKLR